MGYLTSVSGEIFITPRATWAEIKDSPFRFKEDGRWTVGDKVLAIQLDEATADTEEGTLVKRWGTCVVPAADESYKAYGVEADLQELVDSLPGHGFEGHLEGHGEDYDDIWRLYVDEKGNAVKVTAQIVWPS